MCPSAPQFVVRPGAGPVDARAAARLRYAVFVQEMGGNGPLVDHDRGEECDAFDPFCTHLLLEDVTRPQGDRVVGLYRLMTLDGASAGPGFYSATEFDLAPLIRSGRRLLELGRSCLHPDYRGGAAMFHLWQGLACLIADEGIDILFGVASLPGTDLSALTPSLALLHHRHRAPPDLRVTSRQVRDLYLDTVAVPDPLAALRTTPALIKAYLRLGGLVGDGVFVDLAFGVTDVCMVLDTARLNARGAAIYGQPRQDRA
jgi:putative hemolysin